MGTGKTATAINIYRWKCAKAGRLLKALYLGPPIIVQNVKREFQTHSKVSDKVVCLEGAGKKRAATVAQYPANKPAIFVTNYEALLMKDVYDQLVRWAPEVIIFDESHKLKNPQAKRTKQAIKLADLAQYHLILTGTPILNTPMDIFAQYRVMDRGETFGKNYYAFRAEYFYDKNIGMPADKSFLFGSLDQVRWTS